MELNSEELRKLRELVKSERSGVPASEFIDSIRNPSGAAPEKLPYGFKAYPETSKYKLWEPYWDRLVSLGLLEARCPKDRHHLKFGNLTSDGRCYLKDHRREVARMYVHDYSLAIVTGLVGLLGGSVIEAATGWLASLSRTLQSLL